jgi:diacylglycerol kinase family enzyme
MHYIIIANPQAGRMADKRSSNQLSAAASLLKAPIHGLDTRNREEFKRCAREQSENCDVLVAAGGDGTVSDVINAIDTHDQPIAYLPLGTGNALASALGLPRTLIDAAKRIRDGSMHACDLIACNGQTRAFMASVGIEAPILRRIMQNATQGPTKLHTFLRACLATIYREYQSPSARITSDQTHQEIGKLLSCMVVKQPFYGFGTRMMPEARFDDGYLHTRVFETSLPTILWSGLTSFTIGNRAGHYSATRQVTIQLDRDLQLQQDGNLGWYADRFTFEILPGALQIKC